MNTEELKKGETIKVGGIVITVLGITRDTVRMGIVAPAKTMILRKEVVDAFQSLQKERQRGHDESANHRCGTRSCHESGLHDPQGD